MRRYDPMIWYILHIFEHIKFLLHFCIRLYTIYVNTRWSQTRSNKAYYFRVALPLRKRWSQFNTILDLILLRSPLYVLFGREFILLHFEFVIKEIACLWCVQKVGSRIFRAVTRPASAVGDRTDLNISHMNWLSQIGNVLCIVLELVKGYSAQ